MKIWGIDFILSQIKPPVSYMANRALDCVSLRV